MFVQNVSNILKKKSNFDDHLEEVCLSDFDGRLPRNPIYEREKMM